MPESIPANVEVSVVIARSPAHLRDHATPVIAIYPDRDNWNDYGRNFFANVHVRPINGDPLDLHMRFMFKGRIRSERFFYDLIEEFGDVFPIERVETPFVSLLVEVDHYRQMILKLGFEVGVSALRKMHDATVARVEGSNQQILELIDDEEFHIGALRVGNAYEAFRRGSRFFRPDIPDPVNDAAKNFVFSAQLSCADNPYTLPFLFDCDGVFRDRASVLVGRNGVGKTQLLNAIVDGLSSGHPDRLRRRFLPAFRPSRVLVFSSVPTDPYPRSIGSWHGIDYEYFPINAMRDRDADPMLSALVACKKWDDRTRFGEERDKSRMDVIQDAIEPIGIWTQLHLPLRARHQASDIPYAIESGGERYFPIHRGLNELDSIRLIQQIDWSRPAIVLDNQGSTRRLSSGEYAMLRFAAQASSAIEQGSLLLLDEPETHLHPNFVSDLMEILDNLLQSTLSIAVIATHSAYIVRETPRNRVHVFTLEDRQIKIDTPRIQTFGATIDSISQFIFKDTTISHRFQKTLRNWAEEYGRDSGIEGVIDRHGEELNSESLSFIARHLAHPSSDEPEVEEP